MLLQALISLTFYVQDNTFYLSSIAKTDHFWSIFFVLKTVSSISLENNIVREIRHSFFNGKFNHLPYFGHSKTCFDDPKFCM